MTALIIVIAVVAIIAIYLMTTYNSFVKLRNQAEEAGAGIDVHLKERYDLIPNLVETVKGYAKHESSTLEAVIKARNSAMSASTLEKRMRRTMPFQERLSPCSHSPRAILTLRPIPALSIFSRSLRKSRRACSMPGSTTMQSQSR